MGSASKDEDRTAAAEARQTELLRRRSELASDLRRVGAGALVGSREGVVAYLTGYTTRTWSNSSRPIMAVLFADESLVVVCVEAEADAVRQRVPLSKVDTYAALSPVDGRLPLPDGRVQFVPEAAERLRRLLEERSVEVAAVEGFRAAFPPVAQITSLVPEVERRAIDASRFVWARRLRKSEWEVGRLRNASEVLRRAFEGLEARLRPGLTERRIHGIFASAAFEAGADELGYTNVVAGTDRGLFGAPTDRAWQSGQALYVDGGVVVDGYWADFCRMYTIGPPTPLQTEGYGIARSALRGALAAFEPGSTAADLYRLIAEALGLPPNEAAGFGRFGHGIGLYMPEPPSIHGLDDTPLAEGTVLCIEPAVLSKGANYVVEEEHVVREGRLERISPAAPEALIEL
jgi:Xaa-Pro aminopeptidase